MTDRLIFSAAILLGLLVPACTSPDGDDSNSGHAMTETGGPGDGDPGDPGDGDPGDGDPGDGDPGDGDPGDGGCSACAVPPDNQACGFKEVAGVESLEFDGFAHNVEEELDELCVVAGLLTSQIDLECETISPTIDLHFGHSWTPNIELGESLRLVARQWSVGPHWNQAWQLHRDDDSLAIAAVQAVSDLEFVGVDALPVTVTTGLCAPECMGEPNQQIAFEQVGLELEVEGEAATVFAGTSTMVGNLEVRVITAYRYTCDQTGAAGSDRFLVFASEQ